MYKTNLFYFIFFWCANNSVKPTSHQKQMDHEYSEANQQPAILTSKFFYKLIVTNFFSMHTQKKLDVYFKI